MRKNKGITLIALVVTIIILLILAGIVITLSLGEHGLMQMARKAKEEYTREEAKGKLELVLLHMQAEKETKEEYNSGEYLTNKIKENGMTVTRNTVSVDGWKFKIDRSVPQIASAEEQFDSSISYTVNSKTENMLNSTVTISEIMWGIQKIVCPNGDEFTYPENDTEVQIPYQFESTLGLEYSFKMFLANGRKEDVILCIDHIPYFYTGGSQEITLEKGTYKIECYGARGGNGHGHSKGGFGGYVCGNITLEQDTQLYLYVGQMGQDGDTTRSSYNGGAIRRKRYFRRN